MKNGLLVLFCLFQIQVSALLVELVLCEVSPEEFNSIPIEDSQWQHPFCYVAMRCRLKELGHDVVVKRLSDVGEGDVIMFENSTAGKDKKFLRSLKGKKVLLMWEPPTVVPEFEDPDYLSCFDKVLTYDTRLTRPPNAKYRQYHYNSLKLMPENFVPFEERDFACMVLSNKKSPHPQELYSERHKLVRFYESIPNGKNLFHLYGGNWKKSGYKCYRGKVDDKWQVMGKHKFVFAYENWSNDYSYITEKIFDAFGAGSVPIYMGAENITDFIPEHCFISRNDFRTYEDLHMFLYYMPEEVWQFYIENIREFLSSEAAQLFTTENLTQSLVELAIGD